MMLTVHKPLPRLVRRPPVKKNPVRVRADVNGIELAGKYIGLVVLFTSTLNWWFYRRIRKPTDDE